MRSRPSSRPSARVLLWLAVLLAAAPPDAHPADAPAPGAILGTVVRAGDGAPVPYANVLETTSRLGASTDERGRFLLAGLPAGRVAIRIQALGGPPLLETLDLAPGDTVRRTYRIASPAHERFLHIRDSLAARGLWPPTLDPVLLAHMQEALDVRVFRLDPEHPVDDAQPDPERRTGPWPIVGETRPPERPVIDALIATLRHSELYLPRIHGAQKLCAGFSPGIDVRFTSMGVSVDLLLCYACGEFSILSGGRGRQSGDFADRGEAFTAFAKTMFPRDPVIRRLGAKAGREAR